MEKGMGLNKNNFQTPSPKMICVMLEFDLVVLEKN